MLNTVRLDQQTEEMCVCIVSVRDCERVGAGKMGEGCEREREREREMGDRSTDIGRTYVHVAVLDTTTSLETKDPMCSSSSSLLTSSCSRLRLRSDAAPTAVSKLKAVLLLGVASWCVMRGVVGFRSRPDRRADAEGRCCGGGGIMMSMSASSASGRKSVSSVRCCSCLRAGITGHSECPAVR